MSSCRVLFNQQLLACKFLHHPKQVLYKRNVLLNHSRCDNIASKRFEATHSWPEIVSEAEKVVGYPTSYLSLRYLFSDEISNIALHLRKLVGSTHPILKTAKKVVSESHSSSNPGGLFMLLLSQMGNQMQKLSTEEEQETMRKQRSLAEIVEMIHTMQLIHTGLVDKIPGQNQTNLPPDIEFGNKISVLSGDYLLANAAMSLAKLQNPKVVQLMAEAIQNFTKSEFVKIESPLSTKVEEGHQGWEKLHYLSSASLMEKGCRSVLEISDVHSDAIQVGSNIGKNIGLAWQAHQELECLSVQDEGSSIEILSSPVIFHLQENKDMIPQLELLKDGSKLPNNLKHEINEGIGPIKTKKIGSNYCSQASSLLTYFPTSDATKALSKMIEGLQYRLSSIPS